MKVKIEQFVNKSCKIHNNFYNYSKFVYLNSKIKGIIICPIHGEFLQSPNNHLRNHGCPYCGGERTRKLLVSNKEEFIRRGLETYTESANYTQENFSKTFEESIVNVLKKFK